MERSGHVHMKDVYCGKIYETEDGYYFQYDETYLKNDDFQAISLTLPKQLTPYHSKTLFAFFDGLIPEGWLLDIAQKNWKINNRDRMGLLLACCKDCIGAVSVIKNEEL
ncbi:MAG: HipA N-terminal domain-containing protein [Saprospiraceae bacterium]|nr:HipA N-terminal domain-containing protein [Saprospiraceae bacterium]MBL0099075.1 HipA N-terminal domain-containing protein [Saprospiraceae bacterium]